MSTEPKTVFGPVPSRRLGISLGIDLIPYKTCNLDCLYCECGPTTQLGNQRFSFADPQDVLEQVRRAVSTAPRIDFITFSGSGEPTLCLDLGTVISGIKGLTQVPVAVITNATLLDRPDVRSELADADLLLPSLDAATPQAFARLNRPCPDLRVETIIDGLIRFRTEFSKPIWLEVFILEGINTTDTELDALHQAIRSIRPERVQLNSLDRPPAYIEASAAPYPLLEKIRDRWADLPVEIIKRVERREELRHYSLNLENSLLNALRRRPLTQVDIETMVGIAPAAVRHYLDILEKEGRIVPVINNGQVFFRLRA